jgi:retron-type reverse transcriptase
MARVVQAALKIVIEPIFEADFLPCSFGFRPKRSQHDALQVLIDESWRGRRWALETDVANCFGEIPHSGLMSAIEERISDHHVLKLLRAMLRAGVMEDGAVHRDVAGTPQGGVVSPVLSTSICTGLTDSGPSAGRGCSCASRMTWS